MTATTPVAKRGAAVWSLAAVCLATALLQVVAGLQIFGAMHSGELPAPPDGAKWSMLLPLGAAVFLNLAAGAAVLLGRVEALAFMGCSLARGLARLAGAPAPLSNLLDICILLVVVCLTVWLFGQARPDPSTGRTRWPGALAMLSIGLAAGHLTVLAGQSHAYLMLVTTGALAPLPSVAALAGSALLYAAVLMLRSRPAGARRLFLLAAVLMALTLPSWRFRTTMSAPFWLGVPFALAGYWLARHTFRVTAERG